MPWWDSLPMEKRSQIVEKAKERLAEHYPEYSATTIHMVAAGIESKHLAGSADQNNYLKNLQAAILTLSNSREQMEAAARAADPNFTAAAAPPNNTQAQVQAQLLQRQAQQQAAAQQQLQQQQQQLQQQQQAQQQAQQQIAAAQQAQQAQREALLRQQQLQAQVQQRADRAFQAQAAQAAQAQQQAQAAQQQQQQQQHLRAAQAAAQQRQQQMAQAAAMQNAGQGPGVGKPVNPAQPLPTHAQVQGQVDNLRMKWGSMTPAQQQNLRNSMRQFAQDRDAGRVIEVEKLAILTAYEALVKHQQALRSQAPPPTTVTPPVHPPNTTVTPNPSVGSTPAPNQNPGLSTTQLSAGDVTKIKAMLEVFKACYLDQIRSIKANNKDDKARFAEKAEHFLLNAENSPNQTPMSLHFKLDQLACFCMMNYLPAQANEAAFLIRALQHESPNAESLNQYRGQVSTLVDLIEGKGIIPNQKPASSPLASPGIDPDASAEDLFWFERPQSQQVQPGSTGANHYTL